MRKVLCMEIGNTTIKVCETDYKKKNPKLYRSSIWETPEKILDDGFIRDKSMFTDYVKEKLSQDGYHQKNIIFTIQSNKILSREMIIPFVKEKRIAAVVAAQAGEYFPKDITDYILTYSILERDQGEKQISLMAYAAPCSLIRHYYSIAELLELNVLGIDTIGNSSYQWLKRKVSADTQFVLQIKEEYSLVTIMQGDVLAMQRSIPYGKLHLYPILSEEAMFHAQQQEVAATIVPMGQAVLKKRLVASYNRGFSNGELANDEINYDEIRNEDIYNDEISNNEINSEEIRNREERKYPSYSSSPTIAVEDAMEALQLFINQVSRIMDYYTQRISQSQKEEKISKLLLIGTGSTTGKAKEFLERELQIPVVSFDAEYTTNGRQELRTEQMEEMLGCVGASYGTIHFIPEEYKELEHKREFWKLYLGLLVASLLAGGVLVNRGYLEYQSALREQKELENKIAQLSEMEAIIAQRDTLKEAKNSLDTMDSSTYRYNEELNQLLLYLEEKLPSSAVIQSFTSNADGFTASITVDSKKAVAKLLVQLQTIPFVSEVQIAGISEVENEEFGTKVVNFSVTCRYGNATAGGEVGE